MKGPLGVSMKGCLHAFSQDPTHACAYGDMSASHSGNLDFPQFDSIHTFTPYAHKVHSVGTETPFFL